MDPKNVESEPKVFPILQASFACLLVLKLRYSISPANTKPGFGRRLESTSQTVGSTALNRALSGVISGHFSRRVTNHR